MPLGAALGVVCGFGRSMMQSSLSDKEQGGSTLFRLAARLGARDGHWRSVGTLMTGTVGAQAIGAASMLAQARLYSPSDFGAYAFFFAVAGLFTLLSTGRYDLAVYLVRTPEEAAGVALLGLGLAAIAALILLGLSPLAGPWLEGVEAARMLAAFMPLLALTVLVGGALLALMALATQARRYGAVTRSRLAQALAAATVSIALGFAGLGPIGLVAGFIAGQVFALLTLAHELDLAGCIKAASWRMLRSMAVRYAGFPRYVLLAELLNYLGNSVVVLGTPAQFGAAHLGQFNMGQRVAALPLGFIGSAMGEVFRANISPQHADAAKVAKIFRATALRLAVVGLFLTLPLLLAAPLLFEIVLGATWRDAGLYIQILSPVILARFIASPLSAVLMRAGRQRLVALLQGLFILAACAALGTGIAANSFLVVVATMAVLQTVVYGIFFIASVRSLRMLGGGNDAHGETKEAGGE